MDSETNRADSYCLVGLSNELAGKRFLLHDGATLGRAVGATVFLPDPALGRQHARLDWTAEGPRLVNCSNEPGLAVNGQQRSSHLLRLGDILTVGRFELRVDSTATMTGDRCVRKYERNHARPVAEIASSDKLRNGTVLTIRLVGSANHQSVSAISKRLWHGVAPLVAAAGGVFHFQDPLCPRVVWYGDEKLLVKRTVAIARLTQGIHRLAFLCNAGNADLAVSMGLAEGTFREIPHGSKTVVWGEAAEKSLRMALLASNTMTLMAAAHDERTFEIQNPATLAGYMGEGTGRRQKYVISCPLTVVGSHHAVRALLVRANFDPETQKTTVTALCRSPIEMNEDYTLVSVDGDERTFCSRTFERLSDGQGIRVQMVGNYPMDVIASWLGFRLSSSPVLTLPFGIQRPRESLAA